MSYARMCKGYSDIYFYGCSDGVFECASCCLTKKYPTLIHGYDNAIKHIEDHIKAGHLVPGDTISLLKAEKCYKDLDKLNYSDDEYYAFINGYYRGYEAARKGE